MKKMITMMVVFVVGTFSASATVVTLDTGSLASTQGWSYNSNGLLAGYSETDVFSTDGSVLTMNTMPAAYSGGVYGGATYRRFDVVNTAPLAILEWTSRTLENESDPGWSLGFFAGFIIDNKQVTAGIHTNQISLMDGTGKKYISIDATEFHTYRIEAVAGASTYDFYIDGALQTTATKRSVSVSNRVMFGDGTGGANAKAEISSLEFSQIPEPGVIVLMSIFSGGIVFVRRLFPAI
jgi:hypothetical protein